MPKGKDGHGGDLREVLSPHCNEVVGSTLATNCLMTTFNSNWLFVILTSLLSMYLKVNLFQQKQFFIQS